jgi:hypothetical protein
VDQQQPTQIETEGRNPGPIELYAVQAGIASAPDDATLAGETGQQHRAKTGRRATCVGRDDFVQACARQTAARQDGVDRGQTQR